MSDLEKFWNEKHPQQRLIYAGRSMSKICPTCASHTVTENILLDVRNLITSDDVMLQDLIQQHNLKAESYDETMHRIQKFVVQHVTYVGDDDQQGVPEYWQFPFETIHSKIGDCEDFAILIASLALNAGIPNYRVRVVAGLVKPHEITAPEGGHGYVAYLRGGINAQSPGDWVAIDGCFYEDSNVLVKDKPPLQENSLYREVWFSFNNQFSWGNTCFNITKRLKSKR